MNVSLTQNEWLVWPQNQAYSNQENRQSVDNLLQIKNNNIKQDMLLFDVFKDHYKLRWSIQKEMQDSILTPR